MAFSFELKGQIRGGKNNMIVTRNGLHFPCKQFVAYRTDVLSQLDALLNPRPPIVNKPCKMVFTYTPGDLRRRDVPAMCDSLFHCFEKWGLIEDDCLIEDVVWNTLPLDREKPKVKIEVQDK